MPRIDWPSIGIDLAAHASSGFLTLDWSVVARRANALQVVLVKEQHKISAMWDHMVGNRCCDDATESQVRLAKRLLVQLLFAEAFPRCQVVERAVLGCSSAAPIGAAIAH